MGIRAGRRPSVILLAGVLAVGLACTKAPDDSQLTSQIQSKLNEDSGLHGKPITVQTSGGVVTISGTVENETQREAASRYASATPGIKEVVNNLHTAAKATVAVSNQMGKTVPPAPESSAAKPLAAKPRPSTTRYRRESDSVEMAANAPPPAVEPAAEEPPTPTAQPAPPPPPPAKKVTVPSGTSMAVRLIDPIDSEKAQPGQTFRATLDAPLPADGDAVPSGYDVKGHIEDVKSAGKFAGQSLLVLQLDSISVSGRLYGIDADPYRRQGKNRSTNTAEKVGGGAVLGAILGGIIGGGKGAGVGAAAGGGVGGGVQAAGKGQQIQLPSETVLNFTLRSPLTVTLADQGPDSSRRKLAPPQ
ncbi:MAG TPA: BON domain-containing protein [Terriglobales bacterium]|nr:BON domain-containing protein [Terriglobales bacterium]